MKKFDRKQFLRKAATLAAALTISPRLLYANEKSKSEDADETAFRRNEHAIIDLHCHPSQKMWLWNKKFWNAHLSVGKGENLFPMQENHHQFMFGNVRGVLASHYLLEAATEREWNTLRIFFRFIKFIPFLNIINKIEYESPANFDQIIRMIDKMTAQLDKMNSMQSDVKYVIATDYKKYEDALNDPKSIAVAHAIEGGHALGRAFPISRKRQDELLKKNPSLYQQRLTLSKANDPAPYIKNLKVLAAKGVCLITLSHFFRNDLCYPVDGISPDSKTTPGMAWEYTPDQDRPLSHVGKAVVKEMLRIGVIADLTHTAPMARQEIFALNKARANPRPLVFTHTGAQQIYEYYDMGHYPYYKFYAVSDEEIAQIEECNGVIGVIAENFWLTGADANMPDKFPKEQFRYGIPYIIQTLKYINSKTNSKKFDHVGIGTDFDGLADNPKDLYKNRQLADLFKAMQRDPELNQHDYIEKICYRNSQRVLQSGWGNPDPI